MSLSFVSNFKQVIAQFSTPFLGERGLRVLSEMRELDRGTQDQSKVLKFTGAFLPLSGLKIVSQGQPGSLGYHFPDFLGQLSLLLYGIC